MDHRLSKFVVLSVIVSLSRVGHGAKILLVTDQASGQRAAEIKELLMKTPPFSLFENFQVVTRKILPDAVQCRSPLVEMTTATTTTEEAVEAAEVPESCKATQIAASGDGAAAEEARSAQLAARRLVVCDMNAALTEIAGNENADRTIFIKESEQWGGAAGSSITVTTTLPPEGAVHELLHTFGMEDEYGYSSACEADTYCPFLVENPSPNVAVFEEKAPYGSDGSARSQHSQQIHWYGQIKPKTMITTGDKLGTPTPNNVGLFRVGTCEMATQRLKSWRPGYQATIMQVLNTSYIPESYWPAISEGLGARIRKFAPAEPAPAPNPLRRRGTR